MDSGFLPPDFLPLLAVGYEELPWYGNVLIALWLWCLGANVGKDVGAEVPVVGFVEPDLLDHRRLSLGRFRPPG